MVIMMSPAVSSYNDVERVHVATNSALGSDEIGVRATTNGDVLAVRDRVQTARFNGEYVTPVMLLDGDLEKWLPASFDTFCHGNMVSTKGAPRDAAAALRDVAIVWPDALHALRRKFGLLGDIAPLTFGQLLERAQNTSLTHVSQYRVVLATPPLTAADCIPLYYPIPRAVVDIDDSTLGKRKRTKGASYLSAGETAMLLKRMQPVLVTCPDGSKRRLVDVVTQPDLFLPSRLLDEYYDAHRRGAEAEQVLTDDNARALVTNTMLDMSKIKDEMAHRATVTESRRRGAIKGAATRARNRAASQLRWAGDARIAVAIALSHPGIPSRQQQAEADTVRTSCGFPLANAGGSDDVRAKQFVLRGERPGVRAGPHRRSPQFFFLPRQIRKQSSQDAAGMGADAAAFGQQRGQLCACLAYVRPRAQPVRGGRVFSPP